MEQHWIIRLFSLHPILQLSKATSCSQAVVCLPPLYPAHYTEYCKQNNTVIQQDNPEVRQYNHTTYGKKHSTPKPFYLIICTVISLLDSTSNIFDKMTWQDCSTLAVHHHTFSTTKSVIGKGITRSYGSHTHNHMAFTLSFPLVQVNYPFFYILHSVHYN
jgi:hypothetical protein